MNLVIREHDARPGKCYGLDDSFVVESELVLFAEDGVLRYEVVAVPPLREALPKGRPDCSWGTTDKECTWPSSTVR